MIFCNLRCNAKDWLRCVAIFLQTTASLPVISPT